MINLFGHIVSKQPRSSDIEGFSRRKWNHNFKPTAEFLKLREAAIFAPKYDPNLVKAATDELSKTHSVIPFAQAGMGWITQKYIKDAGFCTRGSTDLFDTLNIWLDK